MSAEHLLTKSYLSIWLIENSLRYMYRVGRTSLFDEHKWVDQFIGKSKVNDQIESNVKGEFDLQRKSAELNLNDALRDFSRSRTFVIHSPIEYSTFGDLIGIGKGQFPKWFKFDKERAFKLIKKMDSILGPRNDLAHSRSITKVVSEELHSTVQTFFGFLNLTFGSDEESVDFFNQSNASLSPTHEFDVYLQLLKKIDQAYTNRARSRLELAEGLRDLVKSWERGPWKIYATCNCKFDTASHPCHNEIISLIKDDYRLTSSGSISPAVPNYGQIHQLIKAQILNCEKYKWNPEASQ